MGIRYYKKWTVVELDYRMQHKDMDVKEEFVISSCHEKIEHHDR